MPHEQRALNHMVHATAAQPTQIWLQSGSDWSHMRQIRDFLRYYFRPFLLTEIWSKKKVPGLSHLGPIGTHVLSSSEMRGAGAASRCYLYWITRCSISGQTRVCSVFSVLNMLFLVLCRGGLNPGMVGLPPKWVRLAPNGTNPGFFKISFSTFWLGQTWHPWDSQVEFPAAEFLDNGHYMKRSNDHNMKGFLWRILLRFTIWVGNLKCIGVWPSGKLRFECQKMPKIWFFLTIFFPGNFLEKNSFVRLGSNHLSDNICETVKLLLFMPRGYWTEGVFPFKFT